MCFARHSFALFVTLVLMSAAVFAQQISLARLFPIVVNPDSISAWATVGHPGEPHAMAAFTPGNIVIYRVGDGVTSLTSNAAAVFLDEYTPAGILVQSLALPTTAVGSQKRLLASGTATSEGYLTRSVNGQYLVLAGYDAPPNLGSVTTTTSAAVNRVVARVDTGGNIDTTTALTDAFSGSNVRSVASTNGTDVWLSGNQASVSGIRYTTFGSTTSTALTSSPTNMRATNIFDGQLYVSSQSGAFRLSTVGIGTPSTSGQTTTNLPGFPTATGSPYQFFFADLSSGVPGVDTVYVADDAGGGLQKYSLVSGLWILNGSQALTAARGLTGTIAGTSVTLYVTNGTSLQTLTDSSGYNAAPTGSFAVLATAAASTAFRGVAFAPVASGGSPQISITPPSINFGNQSVATPSGPQTVTISNTGTSDLNVTGVSLTGTGSDDFSNNAVFPQTIAPGNNYQFNVTFTPSARATRSVLMTFAHNAGATTATVNLTGTGVAPVVGVSPASLSFGDQANGTTSAPQAFTISNNGDTGQALQITSIMKTGTSAGEFTVTDDPSPVSIPSGGSVTVHMTFTPTSTGSKLAILTINNNDATNPSPTVSLSGSGIEPEPTVQFAAASFMEDESQTMVVTVMRAGDTTGTSSVQYSMSDGSAWGGASCSTFDYIASAGTLSFTAGETQRTISIPLCADWIAEGTQNFALALSNPTGAALGTQSTATASINDTASQFRNNASIFVGASPSLSTIDVTGAPASIGRVRVTLFDLSFPTPDDIDVLLVGPGGQQILLMADAGGSNSVNSSTLTFSDAAEQVLPDTGQIASGSYEPTSWGIGAEPDFPAPAPVSPYNEPGGTIGGTTTLATVFNGTNGDGTWKLYIRNDLGGDLSPSGVAGQFQGGWGIELLAPTAAPVSISGRITDANGYGIGNVIVRLEGGDLLQPVVFQTGPFGYYSFDGLNPGFTYVVSVAAKRHVFADPIRVVTVNDNVSGVNFTAEPLE